MNFKEIKNKGILLFDGAMGTMIKRYGLNINNNPEIYNFTEEDTIKKIHKEYIKAGSNVITTNTFGANDIRLKNSKYSIEKIIRKGIMIAKEVKGDNEDILIAYDMGPTGVGVNATGKLTFDEAYEIFKKQVIIASKGGVDLILIETILSLDECKAAVKAVKDYSNLPVFCTFTLDNDCKLFDGNTIEKAIEDMNKLEVDAVGINCSPGINGIHKIVKKINTLTTKNIIIQPNTRCYMNNLKEFIEISENEFSKEILKCIEEGAKIVGGCCGTTPEYIRRIKEELSKV
ncbi:MAG: homocysteine S-methyltransferase family protein [Clostridium sp.]|nr:homocysteine S-methyltransferase family protein [Clostridium sp.]